MNKILKVVLFVCCFFGNINPNLAQQDSITNQSFEQQLKVIRMLTETQQYSEAMRKLKSIENSKEIKASLENEVEYRLMVARVLRLSYKFDDAMNQMSLLPSLENHQELKVKVDFRKAALYIENPKYSMPERIKIVYPIIDEGIKVSERLNNLGDLASFYNLKASMHNNECDLIQRNCEENKKVAIEYFKKSMALFLSNQDTLNYHNVLISLFRISLENETAELDSLKTLLIAFTDKSSYAPNVLASRNYLASYFLKIKNDSLSYFKQTVLERDAMVDAVNKNADNTIGKLMLLYEFDSLKADINYSRGVVAQQNLVIDEKNRRISGNILFSVFLAVLALTSIFLFLRQKKLSKKMNVANNALQDSNYNYELLIRESNHRIKNNLQMILSIIELEKKSTNSEEHGVLTNISSKILTIAALHRILDFKEHNQKVRLRTYFNEIIQYFEDFSKNNIVFVTDFVNPQINSERIIYFGLILNELISNSLEHRKGNEEISVQVLKSEKDYIFIYRDNSNFGEFTKNNGIILIESLIHRFGGSNLKFTPELGEYKFYFDE